MKTINKEILKYTIEIILAFIVIIFTSFIWNNNNLIKFSSSAMMYDNKSIVELYIEDLEKKDDVLQSAKLTVRNHGKNKDMYNLSLVIDKKSKLNLDKLAIRINGVVKNVNSLEKKENNHNIFYIIDENLLDPYIQKEFLIDILDDNQEIESLYLSFILDKGQFN